MVAFPVHMAATRSPAGAEAQSCKLALSLHDLLDSAEQMPPTGPGLQKTPSGQTSAEPSDYGADEDGAPLSRRGFQPYHSQSVPKPENLEAHATECVATGVPLTTMMLRNIPNKYTQNSLLKEINELGFAGTYNFFYLPMDVHNRSNVGYAFINFETAKDAESFRRAFSDHRFQRFHSRKIGSVCVAHVQGLDANLRHFENRAVTQARNDQYRPLVLHGQQRVDFDHAVALAKAKDIAPHNSSPAPAAATTAKPAAATPDPRQGLEAAIRELLAASARAPPAEDAGGPSGARPAAAGAQERGPSTQEEDIAQLLSLRSLLISQLHAGKEPQRCAEASSAYTASMRCRPGWGLPSFAVSDFKDTPAYIKPCSMGPPVPNYVTALM